MRTLFVSALLVFSLGCQDDFQYPACETDDDCPATMDCIMTVTSSRTSPSYCAQRCNSSRQCSQYQTTIPLHCVRADGPLEAGLPGHCVIECRLGCSLEDTACEEVGPSTEDVCIPTEPVVP